MINFKFPNIVFKKINIVIEMVLYVIYNETIGLNKVIKDIKLKRGIKYENIN